MFISGPQECAYCRAPIASGDRWVREKIFESTPNGNGPRYFRYHADLFAGGRKGVALEMKLEYLPNGPNGLGLIRLYEYVPGEVRELKEIARELATGAREQISLQGEKWIVPVDDCRLTLQRGDGDFGVRRVGPLSFECELTVDGWRSVVSLLDQFCNSKAKRFQWLTERGRISFLLSLDGQWGRRIPPD